ncbi:MAG: NAD(P)-dependent oxidoreductase [Pseudomonadota bacterium]|nr:NAD(P)-dependent oxidoreductase [Pseudomonadota bacterium]
MARKVFVTGGNGVNGVWVVRDLLARGDQVVVYDLRLDDPMLADVRDEVEFVSGDVRDYPALVRAIKGSGADAIIHLAVYIGFGAPNPFMQYEVNAASTVNIIESAVACGVGRVVFTSSKGAYGLVPKAYGHPDYLPITEEVVGQPFPPEISPFFSVYGLGKIVGETMGMNYHQAHGIDFYALRFGTIVAPGKLVRHGPVSIHSTLIENAMLGKPTHIKQGREQKDDIMYVKDVSQGIIKALLADGAPSGTYNIGTGVGHSPQDMADAIQALYPDSVIEIGPGTDYMGLGVDAFCVFDIAKARQHLGYAPEYDLPGTVRDYIDVMEQFGIAPTPS